MMGVLLHSVCVDVTMIIYGCVRIVGGMTVGGQLGQFAS
jgi:hypothetical protein